MHPGQTWYSTTIMKHLTALLLFLLLAFTNSAQYKANISVDASQLGAAVSPTLHGIFFEEISHAGEGGLYAELIQNRGFEESVLPYGTTLVNGFIVPAKSPMYNVPGSDSSEWKLEWPYKSQLPAWRLLKEDNSIQLQLVNDQPLNSATPHSLQLTINKANDNALVNEGYWGINTIKGEAYQLSFYARASQFKGAITASLQSADGKILASSVINNISGNNWKKYTATLKAKAADPKATFVLSFGSTGTVWLDFVSLFPSSTFKNRSNGLRKDLAQYIVDLHPAFVRWPGGCYVEGISIQNTPEWKNSIGPIEKRKATFSPWGYWSTNGFGYHEYLQFCEDIHAAALYVCNVGVACEYRCGNYVPDDKVDSVIKNVLDAIEYAIGPASSKYGKLRVTSGHPQPFPLQYIEIGNEQHGLRYAQRYNLFYNAIKAKYPHLKLIASMGIGDINRYTLDSMKKVDIADEHAYKPAFWAMRNYDHFDQYKRGDWDMYVGEYATNSGVGAGNMNAALADAVYIMGMEKNSDLVKMSSYAPLLVNANDVDWPVNLINFDAANSFGRISYYAIKLFNENRPQVNLKTNLQIEKPAVATPLFKGSVGLATWDTQTEYSDIEIIQNGTTVYKSDFKNHLSDWEQARGEWKLTDSGIAQTAMGEQRLMWLKNKSFDTYTLKLKAKRLSGYNAFIIPFAVQDSSTQMRIHIGSWWNSHCVFETVTNGYDVAGITNQFKLEKPIETNRWYDIRIEVSTEKVDCYLDDKLLLTYTPPQTFFSIAGKDSKGNIIVKVVNASAQSCSTNIQLNNTQLKNNSALLTSISAPSGEAENSFEHPLQYVPVKEQIGVQKNRINFTCKPFSINVVSVPQ